MKMFKPCFHLSTLAAFLSLTACSPSAPTVDPRESTESKIQELAATLRADRANEFSKESVVEDRTAVLGEKDLKAKQNKLGGEVALSDIAASGKVIHRKHSALRVEKRLLSEMQVLDAPSDALWVGSLVQTESLWAGKIDPVMAQRAPMVISIADKAILVSPAGSVSSVTMNHPSASDFAEAKMTLLKDHFKSSSSFQCEMHSTSSVDEAAFSLGVSAKYLTAKMRAEYAQREKSGAKTYTVECTEQLFKIVADAPQFPTEVFNSNQRLDDLNATMDPINNPIGYVSQVNYGRRLVFMFDSFERESMSGFELSVSGSSGAASGSVEGTQRISGLNSKANLKIFGMGLSDDFRNRLGLVIANPNASSLVDLFLNPKYNQNSTEFAAPLSYSVRYLSNGKIANTGIAGAFYDIDTSEEDLNYVTDVQVWVQPQGDDVERKSSVNVHFNSESMEFKGGMDRGQVRSMKLKNPVLASELSGKLLQITMTNNDSDDGDFEAQFLNQKGQVVWRSSYWVGVKGGGSAYGWSL